MSYCRQFKPFDPLTGMAPHVPFVALGEIAQRARHQLGGATAAQIIELAEIDARIIDNTIANAADEGEAHNVPELARGQRSDGRLPKGPRSAFPLPYHSNP